MTAIAYIRVSDSRSQDSSTQRHAIEKYAQEFDITINEWQEFHLSGSKTNSKQRGVADLINSLMPNDEVIVSDVARLGRDNIHSVLNTITGITTKGASLHFAYSKTTITPGDTNDIGKVFIAIGEAYAAVKFAEERSAKAKAAIDRRRKAGLQVGRQPGTKVRSRLDEHRELIYAMLKRGISKTKIIETLHHAHGVSISRKAFYNWLNKNYDNVH